MITQITLSNFKPFGEPQRVELAPITVVYGPNSSGKSSVLQALLLLKQSMGRADYFDRGTPELFSLNPTGELVNLGSFRSLIHRHLLNQTLELGITFDDSLRRRAVRSDPIWRHIRYLGWPESLLTSRFKHEVTLGFRASKLPGSGDSKLQNSALRNLRYGLSSDGEKILDCNIRSTRGRNPKFAFVNEEDVSNYSSFFFQNNMFESFGGDERFRFGDGAALVQDLTKETLFDWFRRSTLRTFHGLPSGLLAKGIDRGDDASMLFSSPLRFIRDEYDEALSNIDYLGPYRAFPERHYLSAGVTADSVGTMGQDTPQMILKHSDVLGPRLDEWLEKMEIPYKVDTKILGDPITGDILIMALEEKGSGVQVAPTDVGFGIGQLLPIIVEALTKTTGTLIVEQPEIHLHPRLQANVADLMIDTVTNPFKSGDPIQWIVETHSETLMLRLQRRIREGRIKPEDVSVVYVRTDKESGQSNIMKLELDDDGEFIDEWPDGFFDDAYLEVTK